jgi:hypothetical protein
MDWDAESFGFSDEEVEQMARMEHEMWMAYMHSKGWKWGEAKNEKKKTNPNLVPWEALSEAVKKENILTVRNYPSILACADFQICRLNSNTKQPT